MGRNSMGIEILPEYHEMILKELETTKHLGSAK